MNMELYRNVKGVVENHDIRLIVTMEFRLLSMHQAHIKEMIMHQEHARAKFPPKGTQPNVQRVVFLLRYVISL